MGVKLPRVLIVADHASLSLGGEAALPLHYFRVLRKRQIETWLVVHERTRSELQLLMPEELDRIHFVLDTPLHKFLWKIYTLFPRRLSYITLGFGLRLITQFIQRRIIKELVQQQQITVIHQPLPVSPKEPSLIFGLGAPVVMGPMNGGMQYPSAFQHLESRVVRSVFRLGRFSADLFNRVIPGKLWADLILVANARTRQALPHGVQGKVIELVENGVDLSVWCGQNSPRSHVPSRNSSRSLHRVHEHPGGTSLSRPTQFVFMGRLLNWKAVDLLITAFQSVLSQVPSELTIIGDGPDRSGLEHQAQRLGLGQQIHFQGWLSQSDCARQLNQADALVLPSLLECGGAVVLEAMAVGLPVIATDWGGPADYLDASCGILIQPDSSESFVQQLVNAMVKLAESPALRHKMGEAGYQKVIQQFDWEVKGDRILEIYQMATRASQAARLKEGDRKILLEH
ncbi:MAG: glycosyltransferase family 4 protein [Oculatellaceae cyanobacterium Prado106]|jgi:glycosyltransferase involved in cell wall biosynthesis|nr:glycosyltransferase family 4 protein [Oculatellaceae cyanobacterium Prado106]